MPSRTQCCSSPVLAAFIAGIVFGAAFVSFRNDTVCHRNDAEVAVVKEILASKDDVSPGHLGLLLLFIYKMSFSRHYNVLMDTFI